MRTIKKIALAAVIVAMALVGSPGFAEADTGAQEFTIVKIGANTGTVVARGLINAVGSEENTRHQVPLGTPFSVTFSFRQGDLSMIVTPGPPQIDANPKTCVTRVKLSVSSVVTGGTGVFTGATGGGTGVSNIRIVRGRSVDGSCLGPAFPPVFEIAVARSTITLTLP